MPLHDSFKNIATAAAAMRLPKMASVPTVDDLSFALSLAVKNQKNIVELPWKSPNNPINYIIKVTCAQSLEVPTWYLHVGDDEDQPVLWNYDTADAPLIHSLVTAECERTTYTAPLEQDAGLLPAEVQFPPVANNGGPEPYLPREHEQPIPSFNAPAARPAFDTSLNWNNQAAPSSQNSTVQTAPASVPPQFAQPVGEQQFANANSNPASAPASAFASQPSAPETNNTSSPNKAAVAKAPRPLPPPIDLDRTAVDNMYKSFTNADTGFISHAAFLFFLVNEFNRYQKDPKPLSVVRFDLAVKPAKFRKHHRSIAAKSHSGSG